MLLYNYEPDPDDEEEEDVDNEENNEFYPFSSMEELMSALDM